MRYVKNALFKGSPCLALIAMTISGCAAVESARVVEPGDRVGLHFTCRQKNGEIAVSTRKEINDSALPKSPAFKKRSSGDAVLVEAGTRKKSATSPEGKPFEDEVLERLAELRHAGARALRVREIRPECGGRGGGKGEAEKIPAAVPGHGLRWFEFIAGLEIVCHGLSS